MGLSKFINLSENDQEEIIDVWNYLNKYGAMTGGFIKGAYYYKGLKQVMKIIFKEKWNTTMKIQPAKEPDWLK